MCFVKSGSSSAPAVVEPQPVIRHEADAELTKNTQEKRNKSAFLENIKTSAQGIDDYANVKRKTLLGE